MSRRGAIQWWQALAAALVVALCGCPPRVDPKPPGHEGGSPPGTDDPLGARPELAPPAPYRAPEAETFTTSQGLTVWLVERHEVPMVAVCLAIPSGSAADPKGQEGLAQLTASMLDEGAGDRDAVEVSTALANLGVSLSSGVTEDGSLLGLRVLKRYFPDAFAILADVAARPRFERKDFERTKELWKNQLQRLADEPTHVSRVVSRAVLYGPDTPYGHPTAGRLESAGNIQLPDVQTFYQQAWRPDQALLAVAGDISRSELEALLAKTLGSWKRPAKAAPRPAPAPPRKAAERPRLVLVDRPNAPQAVVAVVRPGVAISNPDAPLLELINTAFGGSFTSRLNQNLREEHGWTYGAASGFHQTRGVGQFVIRAAVETAVTAAALRQVDIETTKMREHGLTADEFVKVRAGDVTDLIQTHETLDGLVWRLADLHVLGRPADFDAGASRARQKATRAQLEQLASKYFDAASASVIVVGPSDQLRAQLRALDLGAPVPYGPDGRPLPKQ